MAEQTLNKSSTGELHEQLSSHLSFMNTEMFSWLGDNVITKPVIKI
jgi:hypothetical protein